MKTIKILLCAALAAMVWACDEETTVGSTLLGDQVEIIVDSTFTVTGRCVPTGPIRPRSTDQLIGAIDVAGFGTIRASALAQFLPTTQLSADFSAENIDSVFMNFRYSPGAFIGDSLAPMAITVYPLTAPLTGTLTADTDPAPYYNPNNALGSTTFNTSVWRKGMSATAVRTVSVRMPLELGQDIFNKYTQNPEDFANGQAFAANVFPGVYVSNTFGSGRLMDFARTTVTMNLRKISYNTEKEDYDTIDAEHEYLYVAPEVYNSTLLDVRLCEAITQKADAGTPMMVAPGCYETELRLPVPEIIAAFRASNSAMTVMNKVTFSIPVDSLENAPLVEVPKYALLVVASERDEFFAENKLPDNKTSFYAEYSAGNGAYNFYGLGEFVKTLMEKESLEEADYTFRLCPVQISFEEDVQSSYYTKNYIVSDVVPCFIAPYAAIVRLEDAKVVLTYSRQTTTR